MSLYERLEKLRKERGVSQSRLEKDLGFSNGSYSKWKNSAPTMERLQKIADYFNVSIEYLMTGSEPEDKPKYYFSEETAQMAQELYENKDLRMLFDASRDATAEDLQALHTMALALKRKSEYEEDY